MRYCSRCGVPRILTAEHRWDSSGTISLARDESHRMVIVDNVALTNILDSVRERTGVPVEPIVTEAKRKSGRHFMDAVLSGARGVAMRNLASASVYRQLGKQSSMLGLGNAEVTAYRRHRVLEGVVTDVYSGPAMAGDICGSFDSVEGRAGDVSYEMDGNGCMRLTISASGRTRPRGFDGPVAGTAGPLPGRNIFELCPVCKAPAELGRRFSFDMDRGTIHEAKTGHRVVMIGVISLQGLFGELEAELGQEIPQMIMAIEKDRVRDVIKGKGKDLDTSAGGYIDYMRTLRIRGMGNGTDVSVSGKTVKARVENPYFEPLAAGFLAGFYEATCGVDAQVRWTPASAGHTEVTLEPA